MLIVNDLGLGDVREIIPRRFEDSRGYFSETYNRQRFADAGITQEFVQDNHSISARKGTLRGLHLQVAPFAQAKIVRVTRGKIFDVAVNIDIASPDFGRWVAVELTAEKGNQLYVPAGFAHGFLTLENDTEVCYKVDNHYSAEHDRSIRYDDPQFSIEWPDTGNPLELSDKDRRAPFFSDL